MDAPKFRPSQTFFLSLTPVNVSLTAGTSIPAPPDSPPLSCLRSYSNIARPPTPGGGPLSSHPTSPIDAFSDDYMTLGSFPPTPDASISSRKTSTAISPSRQDSVRPATSPVGSTRAQTRPPTSPSPLPPQQPPPPPASRHQLRRPGSVRKLLSLRSLRNSFIGIDRLQPSLAPPEPIIHHHPDPTHLVPDCHPPKRPYSPNPTADDSTRPQLRKKKPAGWFRRKSGLFMFDADGEVRGVEHVQISAPILEKRQISAPILEERPISAPLMMEEQQIPPSVTRVQVSAPVVVMQVPEELSPPPSPMSSSEESYTLPGVESLGGGRLTDGGMDAEDLFREIGR
ncbi:hypothetical protein LTR50_000319 [Elasticomyces elasticus]|nr:hypothetical protein LTR50_000319 [Elasticomyces elasticus]